MKPPEEIYHRYLTSLLAGNYAGCRTIVESLREGQIDIRDLYTQLFQRSLYQIGDLWENNRISVAVEHLATAITERILSGIYPTLLSSSVKNNKRALVSCSVNEYHQVGARMVADIMEMSGWDVWFLGANTPAAGLLSIIQEKKPDLVGLSLSIYFNLSSLVNLIEKIRSCHPHLEMIIGGQAFRWGGLEIARKFNHVTWVPSIHALAEFGVQNNKTS